MANKLALVFGGSRGIGAACVQTLAESGFDVAYTYVSSAPGTADAKRIRHYRADVGAPAEVAQAFADAQRDFGAPVSCVVANAGIGAHPAYVATVIAAEPLDLAKKIGRAKSLKGPRLILALALCPPGWEFDPQDTIDIGRLAVRTGIFPLKEYVDGQVVHTYVPHPRVPVEEYLKKQERFRHLFEPRRNEVLLAEIQAAVDNYWNQVS